MATVLRRKYCNYLKERERVVEDKNEKNIEIK